MGSVYLVVRKEYTEEDILSVHKTAKGASLFLVNFVNNSSQEVYQKWAENDLDHYSCEYNDFYIEKMTLLD